VFQSDQIIRHRAGRRGAWFVSWHLRIVGKAWCSTARRSGFAKLPPIARFEDVYGTRAAAIAVYPMYKGLAQLVGSRAAAIIFRIGRTIRKDSFGKWSGWPKGMGGSAIDVPSVRLLVRCSYFGCNEFSDSTACFREKGKGLASRSQKKSAIFDGNHLANNSTYRN